MLAVTSVLLVLVGQDAPLRNRVATEREITRSYETKESSSDGSTGNSHGHSTLLERVIASREGGIELEYDLPRTATKQVRARDWQFPARVFRPATGSMRLLNADQLQRRLAAWLRAAKLDRSACGRTVFTWAAFKIECDPQAVLTTLAGIDLRTRLRAGGRYADPRALAPGLLVAAAGTLFVTLPVDPAAVLRERAESDVVVGEIMRQPVSLDTALATRSGERVAGTIRITFQLDSAGATNRRTRVTSLEITRPSGVVEQREATEIVDRCGAVASCPAPL